jgi:hypothetical protein
MSDIPDRGDAAVPKKARVAPTLAKTEGAIEQLAKELAVIQAQLSANVLTRDAKEKQDRSAEIQQRMKIRWRISVVAVVVLVLLFLLAISGLCLVFARTPIFLGHMLTVPSGYAIALFVAPVASITAITVGLIYGAFRQYKEDDLDSFAQPIAGVASNYLGN